MSQQAVDAEINSLKVRAYDILAMQQQMQNELNTVNQRIAELHQNRETVVEEPKGREEQ